MEYKKLMPCIFIKGKIAVTWFTDFHPLDIDPVALAIRYSDQGADELIVMDVSETEEEKEQFLSVLLRMSNSIRIPLNAGLSFNKVEDIRKITYTGAKRAIITFKDSKNGKLLEDAAAQYGREKIAVSLNDFDTLFKNKKLIQECSSEIIFMHRTDLNSVNNITDIPCVILTDSMNQDELLDILAWDGVRGISGKFISQMDTDFYALKNVCDHRGISMTTFESKMDFSEFKLNDQGLIPVIVQSFATEEVLMLAYMNKESYDLTIKTGRMTYFSRSRQSLWVKGETSGHFQYVRSLTIDCDKDTILAKVDQIGAACHTGNRSCFFQPLAGNDGQKVGIGTMDALTDLYRIVKNRKIEPRETSSSAEQFAKGLDEILRIGSKSYTDLAIAAKNDDLDSCHDATAHMILQIIMIMVEKGLSWNEILKILIEI